MHPAVGDALAKNGTAKSATWENPATGARGTITPIAAAAKQDACRNFLASYVHGRNETWLEKGRRAGAAMAVGSCAGSRPGSGRDRKLCAARLLLHCESA